MMICPNCNGNVPDDTVICPDCQENLAALLHVEQLAAIQYNQALALAKEGDLEKARTVLAAAAERAPDSAQVQRLMAKVCANLGEWDAALAAAQRLRELAPEDDTAQSLADRVEAEAEGAASGQAMATERAVSVARRTRQRFSALYEHDVTASFGLGVLLTALIALLLSGLRGHRRRG